jgi:hypothetical protein
MANPRAPKSMSPTAAAKRYPEWDPFGLMGSDFHKERIKMDKIPVWLDEMRSTLEDRWRAVDELHRSNRLAKALGDHLGRTLLVGEARIWYEDAKQDHCWRVRLLNGRTSEGRLYRSYIGITCENGFFFPDPEQGDPLRQLVLHLLDLDGPPDPFLAPDLKVPAIVKDRWVKSRKDGKIFPLFMDGMVIPRRYSKGRTRRLITAFLSNRSREYWADVQDQLDALIEKSLLPFKRADSMGLLEKAVGKPAARLMKTVKDPTLQLTKSDIIRTAVLTPRDKQRAVRLYRGWYPLIQRYLRCRRAGTQPRDISDDRRRRIRLACEREEQPQRVTLQLIVEEMNLAIGLDTLRRKLGPSLK